MELLPELVKKYLEWPPIYVDPDWKSNWFYISNAAPALPKFSVEPPVFVREWFLKCSPGYEDQVEELLERTVCL